MQHRKQKYVNIVNRKIKATVVYRCSKFMNRLRKKKSGLQTKTEGNTSNTRKMFILMYS